MGDVEGREAKRTARTFTRMTLAPESNDRTRPIWSRRAYSCRQGPLLRVDSLLSEATHEPPAKRLRRTRRGFIEGKRVTDRSTSLVLVPVPPSLSRPLASPAIPRMSRNMLIVSARHALRIWRSSWWETHKMCWRVDALGNEDEGGGEGEDGGTNIVDVWWKALRISMDG